MTQDTASPSFDAADTGPRSTSVVVTTPIRIVVGPDKAESDPGSTSVWATLGWAAYLGSAWTWVIGMFLPVLLVRDFGDAGWWAFAVPNVIGAAAVGFVWKSAAASRSVEQKHGRAMLTFSMATLALHGFVIAAWLPVMFGGVWAVAAFVGAVAVAAAARWRWPAIGLGVAVTLVSLSVFGYWQQEAYFRIWSLDLPLPNRLGDADLLAMAPALAFGFLLCPHLDLTLHRARRHTSPKAGKAAFALGFVVVFALMIAFSLMYAPLLRPLFSPRLSFNLVPALMLSLAIHVTIQAAFTTGLHLRESARVGGQRGLILAGLITALGIALGLTLQLTDIAGTASTSIDAGEITYRLLLLLYGLPFPLYVLLFLTPVGKRATRRLRGWVAVAASGLGTPFAVLGLVTEETRWLLGVYGVVLFAAAVVWWRPRPAREEAAALSPIEKGSNHGV